MGASGAGSAMTWPARWMADRTVRSKLFTLAAIAVVAVMLVSWVGFGSLSRNVRAADRLQGLTKLTRVSLETDMAHDAIRGDVLSAHLASGEADLEQVRTDLAAHAEVMRSGMKAFGADGVPAEVRAAADAVNPRVEGYLEQAAAAVAQADDPARRGTVPASFTRSFADVEQHLPAVGDALERSAASAAASVRDEEGSARRALLLCSTLAGLLVLTLSWLVTRAILGPLAAVGRVSDGLAVFDLTRTADLHSKDEFGRMAAQIDAGTTALRTMMSDLGGTALSLSAAATQLSRVSGELRDRVPGRLHPGRGGDGLRRPGGRRGAEHPHRGRPDGDGGGRDRRQRRAGRRGGAGVGGDRPGRGTADQRAGPGQHRDRRRGAS